MTTQPPTLSTRRLTLRPLHPRDAGELRGLLNEEGVRRYLLDGERVSEAWVAQIIADSQRDFAARGVGLWAARDDVLVGVVGYREFHEPPVLELMFAVATARWGQGLAVEMARAAIDFGLDTAGLPRVRASTDEPNAASIRVMERLGMRPSGRTPATPWAQLHFELERDRP